VKPAVVRALLGLSLVAATVAAFFVGRHDGMQSSAPNDAIRATPGVVTAIRDVARLESTTFHIEKVVEASDAQGRLGGLVEAKDALLLVAVGDVVAGVDLSKLGENDVTVDPSTHTLHVRLPAAEVTSATLDEHATHVYSRTTDLLAVRNEQLEGAARRRAEEQMRDAAIEEGILERARVSADRTLKALLRSLGYANAEIDWNDRG
jgi:hypothetical protein